LKKLTLILLISFICFNAEAQNAAVTEKKPFFEGSAEVNYMKTYLWRGALFGNNDVAQPYLELKHNNFFILLTSYFNYIPKNVPEEFYSKHAAFDEQDVEIGFTKSWGKLNMETKVMAYFYFHQIGSPNTFELYNNLTYNISNKFSVFTENSCDMLSYRGAVYSNNGVTGAFQLTKKLRLETSVFGAFANAGFNKVYYGTDKAAINSAGASVDITHDIGKRYFVRLYGEYNRYLSDVIKESTGINYTDNAVIALGINF
jgi:hypothetical protein